MELNKIYHGHVNEVLSEFPDNFFHTIVTSPPYYALRDYDLPKTSWPQVKWILFGTEITTPAMECCLGLEDDPKDFIGHIVLIFREAKRTLRDDGTIWVNMGDSYWGGKGKSGQSYSPEYQNERYSSGQSYNGGQHQIGGKNKTRPTDGKSNEYKPKDMMGIPYMMAFALRSDGWILRQDIVWSKPNPMPESVTDRCTKSHEFIFLLSKSQKYYFDQKAILEPASLNTHARLSQNVQEQVGSSRAAGGMKHNGPMKAVQRKTAETGSGIKNNNSFDSAMAIMPIERNKRSVWTVTTKGFRQAHFAVFPPELIVDCIKAGCPVGGTVLDLFMGSGTTAVVAGKLERNWVGIDLSETYINTIANPRIDKELGLFR